MKHATLTFIILLSLNFSISHTFAAILKFTGFDCELIGNSEHYVTIDYCRLKAVRRDYTELSARIHFHELPVHNITGTVQFFKRANGFKPFLYKVKFNVCRLMMNARYPISFEKVLFDVFKDNLNFANGTCPWKHKYFLCDKFGLTDAKFPLPLPDGVYMLEVKMHFDGVYRFHAKIILFRQE